MSIVDMVLDNLNQICIYWGNPVNDGYGKSTFDPPRELICRWQDMNQIVIDAKGREITSRAVVVVLEDLDEEGMLMLTTLEEFYNVYNSSTDDPTAIAKAFLIKRFQKIPSLTDPIQFYRKAYLTPSLSFGGF